MRLYLAQHALACDKNDNAARPLSNQGREDIARTAGFLSLFEKPRPSMILHSDKLRAIQSAAMFAEAWGNLPTRIHPALAPNSDPHNLLPMLTTSHDDLMLVSHLPLLARLAGLLLCDDAEREPICFRNGGVLCLQRTEERWSLLWQINPTLFYGEA